MENQEALALAVTCFNEWRDTRIKPGVKIPQNLRHQALDLLPHYPISHITKALRVSSAQIKSWQGIKPKKKQVASFVTLPKADIPCPTERLSIEVSFNNGCHLKLNGDLSDGTVCALIGVLSERAGS